MIRKVSFERILNLDYMRVDSKVLRDEMLGHLEEYDNKNPNLWVGFIKLLIEANQIDGKGIKSIKILHDNINAHFTRVTLIFFLDAIAAVQKFRKIDIEWDRVTLANVAYLEGNIMESLGKDEEASRLYDDALALEFSPVFDDAKHHVNKRLRNK